MAKYTIIKLFHLTPLHIGTGKENYDFSSSDLHSDTLMSALAAIRAQQGKSDDIDKFLGSFILSSAFPFLGAYYFFPKMNGKIDVTVNGEDEHEYRKNLKNIKFVDSSIWMKIINGEKVSVSKEQIKDGFLVSSADDFKCICKSQVSERVSVPRSDGQNATPFFFDWKYYDKEAGLYCLTDAQDSLLKEIVSLFSQLGDYGLGTDKSVGGGKFEVKPEDFEIQIPQNAHSTMLLSLYIPTEEELSLLNLKESKYNLLLRGGYIAGSQEEDLRHLRKKVCLYVWRRFDISYGTAFIRKSR